MNSNEEEHDGYTPSPWMVLQGREVVDEGGFSIAHVIPYFEQHIPVQEANAKLIAKAPELYEELQLRLGQIDGMTERIFDLERRLADSEALIATLNRAIRSGYTK